jgi:hypothetical protein
MTVCYHLRVQRCGAPSPGPSRLKNIPARSFLPRVEGQVRDDEIALEGPATFASRMLI